MRNKLSICQYEVISTIPLVLGLICTGLAISIKPVSMLSLIIGTIGVLLTVITTVISYNTGIRECEDELSESNRREASKLLVQIISLIFSFIGLFCILTNTTISLSPSLILYLVALFHLLKLGIFIIFEKKSNCDE